MNIIELAGRLIVIGLVCVALYYLYQLLWIEPEVRTESDRASIRLDEGSVAGTRISQGAQADDDCERYISADHVRACIEARSKQPSE